MNYAVDSKLRQSFCSSRYSTACKSPPQKNSARSQGSCLLFLAKILGFLWNSSWHLGHPEPLLARPETLACQEPPHSLQTHHAFFSLPQVIPEAGQTFLLSSHSATRDRATVNQTGMHYFPFPCTFRTVGAVSASIIRCSFPDMSARCKQTPTSVLLVVAQCNPGWGGVVLVPLSCQAFVGSDGSAAAE